MKRTLFLLAFLAPFFSTAQTITTYAGNSVSPYSGDGGPATAAKMYWPVSVVTDAAGNTYVSEYNNHVVRKIDISGVISVFAGANWAGGGYAGDGGPATAAGLFCPSGLALDGSGNLYIADKYNHRIRKVDGAGIITTVAGMSASGYLGDGVPATATSLKEPSAVAVDAAGNLYIADTRNHMVRMVDASGIITAVAGLPVPGFMGDGGPATDALLDRVEGIAIDATGNIYISDLNNKRIRKVTTLGIISTYAGNGATGSGGDGGPATLAQLDQPCGLATDLAGNLYIADQTGNRIRKVNTSGIINTVAGTGVRGYSGDGGPSTLAKLSGPRGVHADAAGNVYVADAINNRVRKINPSGTISTMAGAGLLNYGDGGPATAAMFSAFQDVATDAAGNVYIADIYHYQIRKIDTFGIVTTIAGNGIGGYTGDGGPATDACMGWPVGIAVDRAGNVCFSDADNWAIRKVNTSGIISTVAGGLGYPWYSGDGGPATAAGIDAAMYIAFDPAGNMYFSEQNTLVRKVDVSGIITTFAGSTAHGFSGDGGPATAATLDYPSGVAADAAGNVFIGDMVNGRVRKVDAAGIITTIAGNGTSGYSGDGGPATAAVFSSVFGVSLDTFGNLYVCDGSNYRVRMIDTFGIINTLAGNGAPGYTGDGGPATAAAIDVPFAAKPDDRGHLYICTNVLRKVSGLPSIVVPTLSSGVLSSDAGTSVFPNPASTILHVSAQSSINSIMVFDVSGKTWFTQKYCGQHTVIDVKLWPPGLYYIRINNSEVRKFTRQ